MKEMDLILGPYADARLEGMADETLTLYDAMLDENDQDLLPWCIGQIAPPDRFAGLRSEIASFARARFARP